MPRCPLPRRPALRGELPRPGLYSLRLHVQHRHDRQRRKLELFEHGRDEAVEERQTMLMPKKPKPSIKVLAQGKRRCADIARRSPFVQGIDDSIILQVFGKGG